MLPRSFPRGIILPIVLLAAAELALRKTDGASNILAPPSAVVAAFFEAAANGHLEIATLQTLTCALPGLSIGFISGTALGILLGLFPFFDTSMRIVIEMIRPIPAVALIPITLLIFSFGYRMEISVIAFATIWPALIMFRSAISQVSPRLREVALLLGLSFGQTVIHVLLPAILPRILVGLRLALGVALVVAVTVEITSNTIGIGQGIFNAARTLNPALSLAYLAWIGTLGWVFNGAMMAIETRLPSTFASRSPR